MFASVETEKAYDFQIAVAHETDSVLEASKYKDIIKYRAINKFDRSYRKENGFLNRDETLRNWGYTPIKSTASGAFRVAAAVTTIFFDIILLPFSIRYNFETIAKTGYTKEAFKWLLIEAPVAFLRSLSVEVADIARGIIEMVPGVGNLAAWGFDELSYKYRKWQNGILSEEELQQARSKGQELANKIIRQRKKQEAETKQVKEELREERDKFVKKFQENLTSQGYGGAFPSTCTDQYFDEMNAQLGEINALKKQRGEQDERIRETLARVEKKQQELPEFKEFCKLKKLCKNKQTLSPQQSQNYLKLREKYGKSDDPYP